ncbi:serine aminopeptidase domain-containing protein [Bartonella sp. CB189]|uniref:serine aminopeptidase domain-containing protein n=1 Tax=Bartonella sp. CB189 TaxID=3112254 RepID=UPI002F9664E9
MKTPINPISCNPSPHNIHISYIRITVDREIRFATTYPEIDMSKGTIIILESYANTIEEYFLPINEISQRGFHTAIFDWFGRETSRHDRMKNRRHHYFDINNDINDLNEFLKKVVYPNCPPPYYMLAYGMGALIALSEPNIINDCFKKVLCISPLVAPFSNKINGFQHKLTQFLSDIGLGFLPAKGGKKFKQKSMRLKHTNKVYFPSNFLIPPPTSRWMASALNTIDIMKKNILNEYFKIPILFILANQNNITNNIEIRKLCKHTHFTESITITGANLDTIIHEENHRKQFWTAFDAFIS